MGSLTYDLKTNTPHLIAEIGINHNGDLNLCFEMLKAAYENGADSVKLQKRNPEVCVPESQRQTIRQTPWGDMTYLEYKKKIEFGFEEYVQIDKKCKNLGIPWTASAWDFDSLEFLESFKLPFMKIASAMVTNLEFVKRVCTKYPLIVASTGMCDWHQIDSLVQILEQSESEFVLMHTVSTYPAEERTLNLRLIGELKKRYGCRVGYSGHEASISPSIAAVAIGAQVVERHFTLDRSMWGTDQAASLEPSGLKFLSGAIKKMPQILGDGIRKPVLGEAEIAAKLRYW